MVAGGKHSATSQLHISSFTLFGLVRSYVTPADERDMPTILELTIRADADHTYLADARLSGEDNATDQILAHSARLPLDLPQLLAASLEPERYSALLTAMLFADTPLRQAWRQARSYAEALGMPLILGIRVVEPLGGSDLHALGWEMLTDPDTGHRLGLSERTLLVRYCNLDRPLPVVRPRRSAVAHVIAVASPSNLAEYGLPQLPTTAIVADARQDFTTLPSIVLDSSVGHRRATLTRIIAAMRGGPRMLYLVCHGKTINGEVYLWLENETGHASPTAASTLIESLSGLGTPPPLIALLACEGAGRLHDPLVPGTLGPRLISAGAPAVLLFRGQAPIALSHTLMPTFWRELARDGFVARALGVARSQSNNTAWSQSVLWSRIRDGHIWI